MRDNLHATFRHMTVFFQKMKLELLIRVGEISNVEISMVKETLHVV